MLSIGKNIVISIHSLRMEGDKLTAPRRKAIKYFNPLPPHGGRPTSGNTRVPTFDISIHSLRMEGDAVGSRIALKRLISIHSLRMEGDLWGTW